MKKQGDEHLKSCKTSFLVSRCCWFTKSSQLQFASKQHMCLVVKPCRSHLKVQNQRTYTHLSRDSICEWVVYWVILEVGERQWCRHPTFQSNKTPTKRSLLKINILLYNPYRFKCIKLYIYIYRYILYNTFNPNAQICFKKRAWFQENALWFESFPWWRLNLCHTCPPVMEVNKRHIGFAGGLWCVFKVAILKEKNLFHKEFSHLKHTKSKKMSHPIPKSHPWHLVYIPIGPICCP